VQLSDAQHESQLLTSIHLGRWEQVAPDSSPISTFDPDPEPRLSATKPKKKEQLPRWSTRNQQPSGINSSPTTRYRLRSRYPPPVPTPMKKEQPSQAASRESKAARHHQPPICRAQGLLTSSQPHSPNTTMRRLCSVQLVSDRPTAHPTCHIPCSRPTACEPRKLLPHPSRKYHPSPKPNHKTTKRIRKTECVLLMSVVAAT
jgi:hypothetical protein